MKQIQLKNGMFAIVDDDDFNWLSQWKWSAIKTKYGYYADRESHYIRMHREVMSRWVGRPLTDDEEVDHINQNKLDNRKENLRLATSAENKRNRGKQSNNTSGYKGVMWDKATGKWMARICIDKKRIYIGWYSDKIDAAKAYDEKAKEVHGQFAQLNFQEES